MKEKTEQDQNWWQKNKKPLSVIGVIAVCVLLVALIVLEVRLYGTGFAGKTLFDWLTLIGVLAVPIVVGFGVVWITRTQQLHDQENKRLQREHDQQLANQRAKTEQNISLDKQHEDLLQTYLDRISELLLEKQLRTSEPDTEVRNVARVRTMTVLTQLDARRIGYVFTFLREAGLMSSASNDNVVSLKGADLHAVNWSEALLHYADLSRTNLSKANLQRAGLSEANLSEANLSKANLSGADLSEANLSGANLSGANLSGANLNRANLTDAFMGASLERILTREYLREIPFKVGLETDLSRADLIEANLSGADLNEANLSEVDFTEANLSFANFTKAKLSGAFLQDAKLIGTSMTEEQLKEVKSFKGATMPDGSKHP